jgi:hypothetical protein
MVLPVKQNGSALFCRNRLGPMRKRTRTRFNRVCRPLPSRLCDRPRVSVSHIPLTFILASIAPIRGTVQALRELIGVSIQ